MRRGFQLFFLLWYSLPAWSQSVHWASVAEPLIVEQPAELVLVFTNCEPEGEWVLPEVAGLRLTRRTGEPARAGKGSPEFSYVCLVRPAREGAVAIPAFPVKIAGRTLTVAALPLQVEPALIGEGRVPLANVAKAAFELPESPVWAGEVFRLDYVLDVGRDYFYNLNGAFAWAPAPLTAEEWTKPVLAEGNAPGEPRSVIRYQNRAVVRSAGAVALPAIQQNVLLKIGLVARGAVTEPKTRSFALTTAPATLRVRPLPRPIPANFSGAVGRVKLTSRVSAVSVVAGDPVTWTLTLEGEANWPDLAKLPARSVAKDFRALPPTIRRTSRDGSLFDGGLSEEVVLIATRAGTYFIGPVALTFFDPKLGQYESVTAPALAIQVEAAPTSLAAARDDVGEVPDAADAPRRASVPAPLVPPDPITVAALAPLPMSSATWFGWVALLFAGPLVAWLALAYQRAWRTDPLCAQREARARLFVTLRELAGVRDAGERTKFIRVWQREAATLWGITHAAPRPTAFEAAPSWRQLWEESDRLLYAEHPGPADDWARAAAAALVEKRIPGFSPARVFQLRNLAPFLALILCGGLVTNIGRLAATEVGAVYRRGDFGAAESIARGALQLHPNDWTARLNLSLALAQLGRWDEAAGQAAAAFAQHPADASVRQQLALTAKRAGYRMEVIEDFLQRDPWHVMASRLAPIGWQQTALVALGASALGAVLLLLWAYRHVRSWARWLGGGLAGAGVLGAGVALLMLWFYGPLANGDAAIVWRTSTLRSIPIAGEVAQVTSQVSAGAVVRITRNFLGWSRLEFVQGETGWMRTEDLVPVWSRSVEEDPAPDGSRPS